MRECGSLPRTKVSVSRLAPMLDTSRGVKDISSSVHLIKSFPKDAPPGFGTLSIVQKQAKGQTVACIPRANDWNRRAIEFRVAPLNCGVFTMNDPLSVPMDRKDSAGLRGVSDM